MPVIREGRTEGDRMRRDAAMVGVRIGDHERPRDRCRHEPEASGDLGRQPHLPVQRAEQLANVDDLGLHLDDQQRASRWMPGEDVDEPALAPQAERNLWAGHPLGRDERFDDSIDDLGVATGGDPFDVASPRPHTEVKSGLEHSRDPSNDRDSQLLQLAALDPRNGGVADTGEDGDVDLAKAAANPERAEERSDPLIIHGGRYSRRALTRRFTAPAA
jgi:hypothetical protein